MKKAVIFDFDGIIIDIETLWYDVFKEVMKDYDCDFSYPNSPHVWREET